jgi:hypothetical protein
MSVDAAQEVQEQDFDSIHESTYVEEAEEIQALVASVVDSNGADTTKAYPRFKQIVRAAPCMCNPCAALARARS